MYYPRQIPQLLDETYRKNLTYHEYCIGDLQDYIMCIWHITSKQRLVKPVFNTVLPDGCIDLLIDLNTHMMVFTGFSKNTETVSLEGSINLMGIRFKPGAVYSLFHVKGDTVMDHTVAFSDIEKKYDLSAVFHTTDIWEQIEILKNYLRFHISNADDISFIRFVDDLYYNPTNQCVRDIGKTLGYESRQLQRVFLKHYGISPKVLLNILRLHKCVTLLFDKSISLQDIAVESGFYDQAHFIKEIKRYTGILPTALLEKYKICPIYTIHSANTIL
ncbi:helix-turn-helix domain-containing protein [Faecalicatena sp. AGMB00832]|uniref:Helix-turn-helix domain-containing protein n=1 Tax=Faecalicatena faecalis TaxID=2726362 RepID=A0ABS6D1G3_9FIRM|nr:helix-turn-helix domain-containing protein [Faecalicatena faecalis]MBU3875434.1 helix-turn-helix domain-containing protein [Faecalicatena faecalis]